MRASVLLMCLLPMTVHAAEEEIPGEVPEGFLEFLGMMVEQDGELIDPLTLGNLSDSIETADEGRSRIDSQADSQTVEPDPGGAGNQGSEGNPDE